MEFLGVGPMELMLILVIALIVFGPDRLPEIGAGIGKALREFKEMSQGITSEINREFQEAAAPVRDLEQDVRQIMEPDLGLDGGAEEEKGAATAPTAENPPAS